MTTEQPKPKKKDVLSFEEVGRPIQLGGVADEFRLMKSHLKETFTCEIAKRVCEKSGSHLLKMISPRVDTDHACLYFSDPNSNERPKILPSVNAADLPFCKVLYRPLEIIGRSKRSVIDQIMSPDDASEAVLGAFAEVFGKDVLEAVRETLLQERKDVTELAASEFPVIFVPQVEGGDIQITPVSPAEAFMGVKSAIDALYNQKKVDGLSGQLYGFFEKQFISSKPQNISGAIGGPRKRVLAKLPPTMEQTEAEIYRCAHGGSFPRWRDDAVADCVLRYADMLEADKTYNDRNTRKALNGIADRLIGDAQNFIDEMVEEIRSAAHELGLTAATVSDPPDPAIVLIRRRWPKDSYDSYDSYDKARKALTSGHFKDRMARISDNKNTASK